MNRSASPALLLLVLLPFSAPRAQEWRTEQVVDVGLEIDAPGRLERLPMQLGESGPYQRARFRPNDRQDYVRSQYYWYCDVYEFSKKEQKGDDSDLPADLPPEAKEQLKKMMAESGFKRLKTFKDWLDDKDKKTLTFVVEGKPMKARGGKLAYAHWVWREASGYGPCKIVYCEAAVYTFEEREVALVIEMPLESEKHDVPKSKWKTIIDRMIASGKQLDADAAEDDTDKKRDQYASTPERQAALAEAKKNIAGMQGWDYFTQPNYIVIFAWDFEKPDERGKAKKDAVYYSSRLEKMRELYLANYPLDATGTKAIMPDPNSIPSLTGPVTASRRRPRRRNPRRKHPTRSSGSSPTRCSACARPTSSS